MNRPSKQQRKSSRRRRDQSAEKLLIQVSSVVEQRRSNSNPKAGTASVTPEKPVAPGKSLVTRNAADSNSASSPAPAQSQTSNQTPDRTSPSRLATVLLPHSHKQPHGKGKTIESVLQAKIETAQQKKRAAEKLETSTYQSETQRPLVCLAFIFPMILAYELGTLMLGREAFRSGVDQWLEYFLRSIGFGQLVLLPVLTAAILIVWHHRNDDHWKIRWPVMTGMALETIGLGMMLFWAAKVFQLFSATAFDGASIASIPAVAVIATTQSQASWLATTMAYIGSGIYEELFFRLILLVPAIHWARHLTNRKFGAVIGIFLVSLVFASLHYNVINPAGSPFELSSFFFRFGASIVFCGLFLFRGFGIAVGTHVAFDVLTQV